MKIHIPKKEKDNNEEIEIKKTCLNMAVTLLSAKGEDVDAEKVVELAEKLKSYLEDKKEE